MAAEYRVHEVLRDLTENNGEKHVAIYVITFMFHVPPYETKKKKNLQYRTGFIESCTRIPNTWARAPSMKGLFQTLFFLSKRNSRLVFFLENLYEWSDWGIGLNVNRFNVRSTNDIKSISFVVVCYFMAIDFPLHSFTQFIFSFAFFSLLFSLFFFIGTIGALLL